MADRLADLINSASLETNTDKKLEYLYQVKELSFKDGLIGDFFQDILAFQSNGAPNVKKFCLAFLEDACKHNCQLCPDAILSLSLLLNDPNTEVIKRSIQAASQFYKALVKWITTSFANNSANSNNNNSSTSSVGGVGGGGGGGTNSVAGSSGTNEIGSTDGSIEKTWLLWSQILNSTCALLETTNNDGVRTHCIKFIETIVLMQTPRDNHTDQSLALNLIDPLITPIRLSMDIKVQQLAANDQLPRGGILFNEEHKLQLVEAAKRRFEQLVAFHGASHISSVNLMAAMQSLVVIAKQRHRLFMGRVIQAMDLLNNRLPPTLTESQVQSVKKFLKLQQKRLKLEPSNNHQEQQANSQPSSSQSLPLGRKKPKFKNLDLNKLTQELDEKEKRQIVVDSLKRILGEEHKAFISPVQMDIKKKVLSTLANEFSDTECPKIIQDYIFSDIKNRHEICYAVIKKNFEVAAAKAAKRNLNLFDNQGLLRNYFECYNSYLNRAMNLKDVDKDIILPKLYALKDEFYTLSNQDQDQDQESI